MDLTCIVTWPVSSTESPSAKHSRISVALENSLNCLAAMEQEVQRSFARPAPERMARLSISMTDKGLLHATYTEELTPKS